MTGEEGNQQEIEQREYESILNIYQRMHAAMSELAYIQKGEIKVAGQYRAVKHDDVTKKCHEQFVKHGIYCLPTILSQSQDNNRTSVVMQLSFINIDNPTDKFDLNAFGYGVDNQDKGPGKAVSYAYKYGLLKAFALETGDDPDDVQDSQADYKTDLAFALEEHKESINTIKEGITEGDLHKAAEAWFELSDDEKMSIWIAPSKGGPFTTGERKTMKESEFKQAYYGETV